MDDGATIGLLALAVADVSAYVAWAWGTEEARDRRLEVAVGAATAACLVAIVALPASLAGPFLVGLLWARCAWDLFHAGQAPWVGTGVPRGYPVTSLVAKVLATALYLLFALPS